MIYRNLVVAILGSVMAASVGLPGGHGEVLARSIPAKNSSPWIKAYHTRVRLIAGTAGMPLSAAPGSALRAGIHIEMDPGWKTYWRTPGGAGGVPPYFIWDGSTNIKSVRVDYPAPSRITSDDGVSIGYKKEVVLPIRIVPKDASKPVSLSLRLDYGVCREVCVPVQSKLKLLLSPADRGQSQMSQEAELVARYARRVPRNISKGMTVQPKPRKIEINLGGARPELVVEGEYPGGLEGADLFVEAPEGLYIPLPERKALGDGKAMRFRIDLTKGEDPKLLRGKTLTLTFVSANGQSQMRWKVPEG